MKKIIGLLAIMTLLIVVSAPRTYAQTEDSKITVKTSDLTTDQLAKIKLEQTNAELQKKLDTYGKWVGVGGEIGTAVKDGLTAVVDVADKFGATNVGKFTMTMVAWKVIGKDLVKIVIGLLFFIVFTSTFIYTFKRLTKEQRVLIENPGLFKYPKKYEVIRAKFDAEDTTIIAVIFIIAFLIGIWVTYSVMF
jgi:hypothetical protein